MINVRSAERYVYGVVLRAMLHRSTEQRISPEGLKQGENRAFTSLHHVDD